MVSELCSGRGESAAWVPDFNSEFTWVMFSSFPLLPFSLSDLSNNFPFPWNPLLVGR